MTRESGLRERKKLETRQRIADHAAHLFAEHGFDAVAITDVARAAEVSEQTVYNYFPAKHDLALDRAETIRRRLHDLVATRPADTTPAGALRVVVREDVERHRHCDRHEARGQFFALSVASPVVRRFGLEVRDQQVTAIRDAITETRPDLGSGLAHVHAAGLVAVLALVGDALGADVMRGDAPPTDVDELERTALAAFDSLHDHFRHMTAT